MEVSISLKTARFPDITNTGGSSTTDPHNLIHNKEDLSMSNLKTCLTELLKVEEARISTIGVNLAHEKNHDISNGVGESKCIDLEKSSATGFSASEKCLSMCATFPPPRAPKLSGDVNVEDKGKHEEDINPEVSEGNGSTKPFNNQFYSRSTSLPVPLKLVSALKGSREKKHQGTSPKKLSVTWAPDVYDPIPTSVSHVPSDKNQRYRNSKKYGKYKQKNNGKSSRGSKGKDKKHVRKSSGSSSKPKQQPFYVDDGAVLCEPRAGTLDYNVASPKPFCGSSFLKGSVTKLHFPVAEAT